MMGHFFTKKLALLASFKWAFGFGDSAQNKSGKAAIKQEQLCYAPRKIE